MQHTILAQAHRRLANFLIQHGRGIVGQVRNRAGLTNIVREAFGENTGDHQARLLAQAWGETAEWLRAEYNRAGGHIAHRADWGLPQHHDWQAVLNAGKREWIEFVMPMLDRERMFSNQTGRAMTEQELRGALDEVYETISTGGMSKRDPGGVIQGRAMANRRADPRFLVFKSADNWLQYQQRFGEADPFSIMMGHVDSMARDIAAMRALGPNPNATMNAVKMAVSRELGDPSSGRTANIDAAWELYRGTNHSPVHPVTGRVLAGTRQLLVSSMLGRAMLSALSDQAFGAITAKFNGLSYTRMISRQARLLNPASSADRELAYRSGVIAESAAQTGATQARYVGEAMSPEVTRRVSDSVLRLSGLTAWTEAGRHAFTMEFMSTLADHAGLTFDNLPTPFRNAMRRYGISADDWDVIRATPLFEQRGIRMLRPDDIMQRTDLNERQARDLATRLLGMIHSEREFAVPSVTIRGQAALYGAPRAGTFWGELLNSALMFKNFAVTLAYTHVRRMVEQSTLANKAAYGGALIAGATVIGGLVVQLKDIADGRDPREMNADFWRQAMWQGGGLGIFGDLIVQDVTRYGQGLETTLAGPMVGLLTDVLKTSQEAGKALSGYDNGFWRQAAKMTGYVPGSNLWYLSLTYQRAIQDQLEKATDPKAEERFRRRMRKWERDYSAGYWWQQGDLAPRRAPSLENPARTLEQAGEAIGID